MRSAALLGVGPDEVDDGLERFDTHNDVLIVVDGRSSRRIVDVVTRQAGVFPVI